MILVATVVATFSDRPRKLLHTNIMDSVRHGDGMMIDDIR
jgi:hypothetical protein